jgi:hypothetical protein
MLQLYKVPHIKEQLLAAGLIQRQKFSWDKTADLLWKSFEKMMK